MKNLLVIPVAITLNMIALMVVRPTALVGGFICFAITALVASVWGRLR
jgi:hypothetical protein